MIQNVLTHRDVAGPMAIAEITPARPVPDGPLPIRASVLERLRGLQLAYQSALDTYLMGEGFERGGCAVDLSKGLIYPPGTF